MVESLAVSYGIEKYRLYSGRSCHDIIVIYRRMPRENAVGLNMSQDWITRQYPFSIEAKSPNSISMFFQSSITKFYILSPDNHCTIIDLYHGCTSYINHCVQILSLITSVRSTNVVIGSSNREIKSCHHPIHVIIGPYINWIPFMMYHPKIKIIH